MSPDERSQLLEQLKDKEFRGALVDADIANSILFQLKTMLAERGWTQEELAQRASTGQPVISKYLNGYENFSLKTLRRLAAAFDVSLRVRFESFGELVSRTLGLSYGDLAIQSFSDDSGLRFPWAHATADWPSAFADEHGFAPTILSSSSNIVPFPSRRIGSAPLDQTFTDTGSPSATGKEDPALAYAS